MAKKRVGHKRGISHIKQKLFVCLLLLLLPVIVVLFSRERLTSNASTTTPQPVGQTQGWDLIFNDEFDNTTLDTNKWVTCYPGILTDNGCGHNNNELEWYLPKNVLVANGTLKLRGQAETYQAPDGKTYNYTSGMITTGRTTWDTAVPTKFEYLYGYAEMRAKVPSGQGLWPAFWMLPANNNWPPELDIMEVLGHQPNTSYMTVHWNDSKGTHMQDTVGYTGVDLSKDWHTYAVDWEQGSIRWYIDGIEQRRPNTTNIPTTPMYLLANFAIGGDWPGNPSAQTPFPSDFEIDYVRVWKKTPPTPTPTPTNTPTPTPTRAPTPTPTVTPTPKPSISILQNGSFETGTTSWYLNKTAPANGAFNRITKDNIDGTYAAKIDITTTSANDWYVQLKQDKLSLVAGKTYAISFWAKASTSRTINFLLQQSTSPYPVYFSQTANLTPAWQQFTASYKAPTSNANVSLEFNMAKNTGSVYIDKVAILSN